MGFLDRLVARDHRMAAEKRDTAEWHGKTYESASEKAARKDKARAEKNAVREAEDSRQRRKAHRESWVREREATERETQRRRFW